MESDLEINELGRGEHDGGMGTRNRQIKSRFHERAKKEREVYNRLRGGEENEGRARK